MPPAATTAAVSALYADHAAERSGQRLEGFLEKSAKYTKSWAKRYVAFDPATRELGYGETPVKTKATLLVTSVVRASEASDRVGAGHPDLLSFRVASTADGHSFDIRCPDRATFHEWFFPIQHSLAAAGLDSDFDAGLPGCDPRTGLRFARVPPEYLFRFHLMDRSVLTLFMEATLPADAWAAAASSAPATTTKPPQGGEADPASANAQAPPKTRARTKTFFQRLTAPRESDATAAPAAAKVAESPEGASTTTEAEDVPGERVLLLVINRHLYVFRPTTQVVRCLEVEFIGAVFTGRKCLGIAAEAPERDLLLTDVADVPKAVEVLRSVHAFASEGDGDEMRVRMTQADPAAVAKELDLRPLPPDHKPRPPVPPTPKSALKAVIDGQSAKKPTPELDEFFSETS